MAGRNSLCDIKTDDCTTFQVLGQDFVRSPHLGCKIRPVALTDNSDWSYMDGPLDSRVQFQDDKAVHCSIRESFIKKVRKSYENIILEIEITNNGVVYSNGIFLTIFNSSCHSCSDRTRPLLPTECEPRKDICRHETECYHQGAEHPSNTCLHCGHDGWEQRLEVADIFNGNEITHKMIEGEELDYILPLNQTDVSLSIKSGPLGFTLRDGKLRWRSVTGNYEEQIFVVEGEDDCKHKEEFLLTVIVLKCECNNNGWCVMEDDSARCRCPEEFSGENAFQGE